MLSAWPPTPRSTHSWRRSRPAWTAPVSSKDQLRSLSSAFLGAIGQDHAAGLEGAQERSQHALLAARAILEFDAEHHATGLLRHHMLDRAGQDQVDERLFW